MSEYEWDQQIEYLAQTRWLYYNDDYLEFLVDRVWKIHHPVKIVDYGCGFGFLGLKLLPLLPAGSSYTGIDKGRDLINQARDLFKNLPYEAEFLERDIEDIEVERKYDIAMCHAFLLHMTDVENILRKMVNSVRDDGKVICFETHWLANMANYDLEGVHLSDVVRLGVLQKLYESRYKQEGKNGNIGIRLPILFSQLGLKEIECRVSDKVNFLDPNSEHEMKSKLYASLIEEGIGRVPGDRTEVVKSLMEKGLTRNEADEQYEAEKRLSGHFGQDCWFTYAPNMKISYGTVVR